MRKKSVRSPGCIATAVVTLWLVLYAVAELTNYTDHGEHRDERLDSL
ncbi:hypothetical protein QQY66_42580 [Streptomyces sp. DG2A-72]|nr:hypothetical protein [Streptomyces sp. DG2A-72]MDO0938089.1 hypothetical protein [Streptomyces sp. DG2A-72]